MAAASALMGGAAFMNPGQPQPLSYAQLSQRIEALNSGQVPDPQSNVAPQALPQTGTANHGSFQPGDKGLNEPWQPNQN